MNNPLQESQLLINRRHFFGAGAECRELRSIGYVAQSAVALRGVVSRRPWQRTMVRASRRDCPVPALSRPSQAGHLPLAVRQARRRSTRSTTSRRWKNWTVRTCRTRSRWPTPDRDDLRAEIISRGEVVSSVSAARRVGAWISDLLPYTARSPTTSASSARCTPKRSTTIRRSRSIQTGHQQPGRPSLGAWLSYGLGSENQTCRRSSCCVAGSEPQAAAVVLAAVGQRLSPVQASRRQAARRGRPGAVSGRSAGRIDA